MKEQEVKDIIANTNTWREAAFKLIEALTKTDECYSSGGIARYLRLYSDYKFSVLSVGAYLRDQFMTDLLPLYIDNSRGDAPPVQYSRICEGRFPDRTPQGQLVFVYGPDQDAAEAFDFEVCIPKPGDTVADDPQPQFVSVKPIHPAASVTTGAPTPLTSKTHNVKVHNCGRLCVPRQIFEDALHQGGKAFRAGDPVYISSEGTTAVLSLATLNDPNEKVLSLTKDKGRVRFFCPLQNKTFTAGDVYKAKILSNGNIVIDLSVM